MYVVGSCIRQSIDRVQIYYTRYNYEIFLCQQSSMFMLFFYLEEVVTSQCVHFIFCRGRESLKLTDESVLPVTEKERKGKGKWRIGP